MYVEYASSVVERVEVADSYAMPTGIPNRRTLQEVSSTFNRRAESTLRNDWLELHFILQHRFRNRSDTEKIQVSPVKAEKPELRKLRMIVGKRSTEAHSHRPKTTGTLKSNGVDPSKDDSICTM